MNGCSASTQAVLVSARKALEGGNWADAARMLAPLLAAEPANSRGWELLGMAHRAGGHSGEARQALERAVECDPGRASAHYNYAVCLLEAGALDDAVEQIQAAGLLRPNHAATRRLAEAIGQRIREKRYGEGEGFAAVSHAVDPLAAPPAAWARLECASCGHMNFITARTCARCGSLLPEERDITPVE